METYKAIQICFKNLLNLSVSELWVKRPFIPGVMFEVWKMVSKS